MNIEVDDLEEIDVYVREDEKSYKVYTQPNGGGSEGVHKIESMFHYWKKNHRKVTWTFHNEASHSIDIQLDFSKAGQKCPIKRTMPPKQAAFDSSSCTISLADVAASDMVEAKTVGNGKLEDKERTYVLRIRETGTIAWHEVDPKLEIDDWPTLWRAILALLGVAIAVLAARGCV